MEEASSQLIAAILAGDQRATIEFIGMLTSVERDAQDAALSAVQSCEDPEFWAGLLTLMAEGRWNREFDALLTPGSPEHKRLAIKIYSLFSQDLAPQFPAIKEGVLTSGLLNGSSPVRQVSVELLGERRVQSSTQYLVDALNDTEDHVRWYAAQALGKIASATAVEPLVACLSSHDTVLMHNARLALVSIGQKAVEVLISALLDTNDEVRWEAAKALIEINSPHAAPALVTALEDDNAGVRWLAAEGLIRLNRGGLEALLHGLVQQKHSEWQRRGAHHVLHEIRKIQDLGPVVPPVLAALSNFELAEAVPVAALAALAELEKVPK